MFPLNFSFAGDVAALWTLDAITLNKAHRLRGLESTRSPSKARARKRTVDRVSGHQTFEILLRFGDRGRHVDASGASDQDRKGKLSWDHGIRAHDHRAIVVVDRSSPNKTAHDFHVAFPYKIVFFPF